ncbi:hypothetical protein AU193_04515 [Mycobacterium sp. GA-1285]|nr:hypothetical protein AU193_04515 [Mycobacterium sp. GA-1285]
MCRVQRHGHLFDNRDRSSRDEGTVDFEQGFEIFTFDKPHLDVKSAVDLPVTVNWHDVWFVEARRRMCFAAEPLLEDFIFSPLRRQQLECNDTVGLVVMGAPDLAHPSPA